MISAHTCKSCSHYRLTGCAADQFWSFPSGFDQGVRCERFCYEPGADEAEDWT
jgi:hypothetical protein